MTYRCVLQAMMDRSVKGKSLDYLKMAGKPCKLDVDYVMEVQ